ncbi:MAG: tRNA 2-selenouridine(34) synthase MnmH, partial [Pseudomonadales bacterium]
MDDLIKNVLVNDLPLIDVRAPAEFAKGALPTSVNLPVMDDEERRQVGLTYRKHGQERAIRLGFELVSGSRKEVVVSAWLAFIKANPEAHLYCARGGLRSEIACDWIAAEGAALPRIPGGYKAIRNFLLGALAALPPVFLVSGQTGCGKTRFLRSFTRMVDLEGLANHRGSAFGAKLLPQPPQASFENALAITLLKLGNQKPVLLEDEGKLIGRINLPPSLQKAMAQAPILLIEASLEERTASIYQEYIIDQWADYQAVCQASGQDAFEAFSSYLLTAMDGIKKRLGGLAHREIRTQMETALARQQQSGKLDGHKGWIEQLLSQYYD